MPEVLTPAEALKSEFAAYFDGEARSCRGPRSFSASRLPRSRARHLQSPAGK